MARINTELSVMSTSSSIQKYLSSDLSSKPSNSSPKEAISALRSGRSTIPALRDNMISMINRGEETANMMLKSQKVGHTLLLVSGLPDLSDPEAMARYNRITDNFSSESAKFDELKFDLIRKGGSEGKTATEIMLDIVKLNDDQSDLFKFGIGWNGDVFSFDKDASAGYQRSIDFSKDVVNVYA